MDIQRIHREVADAAASFALVEAHSTREGGIYVKAGLRTSAGNAYVASVLFPNYPSEMPRVFITKPDIQPLGNHIYRDGHLCLMRPNFWNPGRHNLTFVLQRTAKWLNKYGIPGERPLAGRGAAALMTLDFGLLSMSALWNEPGEMLQRAERA